MKTKTTKILCLVFALSMLLSAAVICPSAENNTETTPSSSVAGNLVTHWDFEGDTEEQQLADKAPKGNANNLEKFGNVTIENGVATVAPDETTPASYLWYNNASFSTLDGRVMFGSTYYTKFQFSGTNTGHAYIMQIPGLFRMYRHANGDIRVDVYSGSVFTASATSGDMNVAATANGLKVVPATDANDEPTTVYFAVAFTSKNTTTNKFKITLYLSTDGANYSYIQTEVDVTTWRDGNGRGYADNDGNGVYFGNSVAKADSGLDIAFDDIRIYNIPMSTAQVREISLEDAPTIAGCQDTYNAGALTDDTKYDVRFISTIQTLDYTEAGYIIEMSYVDDGMPVEKTKEFKCMSAYTALTASTAGDIGYITAESLGGEYLLALTIGDIPTSIGEVTFKVTAYGKDNGGVHVSRSVVFVYNAGVFQSATKA